MLINANSTVLGCNLVENTCKIMLGANSLELKLVSALKVAISADNTLKWFYTDEKG